MVTTISHVNIPHSLEYAKTLTIERRASADTLPVEVESLTTVQGRVGLRSVELHSLGGSVKMMESATRLVGCRIIANIGSRLFDPYQNETL